MIGSVVMDKEVGREIILEHFQHPLNKEEVNDDKYIKINSRNVNCIDNLDIYILIEDKIIKDIKFNGEACAISTASASIMIKNLIGKSLKEAINYIHNFNCMCNEEEYDEEILKEGLCFQDIYKQNNRKSCALLPYRDILKVLEEYENK